MPQWLLASRNRGMPDAGGSPGVSLRHCGDKNHSPCLYCPGWIDYIWP